MISRDYMSQGFRQRAAERDEPELKPRTEKEIRAGLALPPTFFLVYAYEAYAPELFPEGA